VSDSTQSNLPLILPHPPILASDGANWKNIGFAHFRQPPCDIPDRVSSQHIICLNVGQLVQLEQAVGGRYQKVRSGFGDLKIYPAYLSQQFHWDKEAEFFNLFLSPSFLATVGYDVFGSDRLELVPYLATLFDPLVGQIGFALKTALEIDGKNSHLYADSLAHALAVHLLSRYSSNSRQSETIAGSLTQQQWRQIVDFIEANLEKNISLSQLAEIVRLSPYHFAHLFKRKTNASPHQYLILRRIERAKQLIVMGNLSLAAIAQTVGFASQGHFTYHFKRLVGVTPKVFWQQSQER